MAVFQIGGGWFGAYRIKDNQPDSRYAIRYQEAEPILWKFKDWMEKSLHAVPLETAIGKALVFLNNQWGRLVAYLEDARYPMDNNTADRAIGQFTIGRKNWLSSRRRAGAKACANLYNLIETAKANKLNISDFLAHIFKELPNAQSIEEIEALYAGM